MLKRKLNNRKNTNHKIDVHILKHNTELKHLINYSNQ